MSLQSFIALLDKPSLPEVILQIMAWLLGEYAYLVPSLDAADVVDYVLDIMERAKTATTRIWGVSALTKLIAQLGRVPEQVDEVLQVGEPISCDTVLSVASLR
jgi:AP-4 complex subunit epsilon-1